MRPVRSTLYVASVFALLTGCSAGNVAPPTGYAPASNVAPWQRFTMRTIPPNPMNYDTTPRSGVYASQFDGPALLGYHAPNRKNHSPVCKVDANYVNGFSVDGTGNLVVPNGYPSVIGVFRGPDMCGKPMGTFKDPYGQASDAASEDAASGTIVVGNIEGVSSDRAGNIAICTLHHGCSRELKSSHITYYGGGVALSKSGDCWMASEDNASLSSATLTYFRGCKGGGTAARGWKNAYYGGLILDPKGYLISIDYLAPAVWVYKGCNPLCHLVGGPFALQGDSLYGNLSGNLLAIGDSEFGQVDVYSYSPKRITYEYSFSQGLTPSDLVEAAGFSPST